MSLDDWVLALHVLSAFALVAGIILFWVLILAARRADTPDETLAFGPFSTIAQAVVGIGMLGTIGFGVWLAFSVGGYDIWDGWIVAALVLWVIAGGLGNRAGREFAPAVNRALELKQAGQTGPDAELAALNRTTTGLVLQTASSLVVLLIGIDMIWKPGA
jgi:thiosulfate reductase cytochrome b subunit